MVLALEKIIVELFVYLFLFPQPDEKVVNEVGHILKRLILINLAVFY